MLYKRIARPILFQFDPERMHDAAIRSCALMQRVPGFTNLLRLAYDCDHRCLLTQLASFHCTNPIGLAAGYDKSGRTIATLSALGFGHLEIGSVSAQPSQGNPKPRLWRLPKDQALCVHYGLPNDGAARVKHSLSQQKRTQPVGINLVNTNWGPDSPSSTADRILDDYVQSAITLADVASYFTLNLSCPNTADGCHFFDSMEHLRELLHRLADHPINVPVWIKVSPDLSDATLDSTIEIASEFEFVHGWMLNLSAGRRGDLSTPSKVWHDWPGAISGRPIGSYMDQRVKELYRRVDRDSHQIISAGGIFSAEDAYRRIRNGASAVQILTALIYEGPSIVRQINAGLVHLLRRDGFNRISDVVGIDVH